LLTTATGLLIAIPVNIGYNFFVTRIDTLILDMERGAEKVLDLAYSVGQNRPLAASGSADASSGASASAE
jgi:biopolymer transport protein ExbB/TolQ